MIKGLSVCFKMSMYTVTLIELYILADFIGLPYFSGFPLGLKSHVLISHDYLSQSKFASLPRDPAVMCSGPASIYPKKICFVSKQACKYCIGSEDKLKGAT